MKKILVLFLAVLLTVTLLCSAAFASEKEKVGNSIITNSNQSLFTLIPDPELKDKISYDPRADMELIDKQRDPQNITAKDVNMEYLSGGTDKDITPPGGSKDTIQVWFNSTCSNGNYTSATFAGDSKCLWQGTNPFNCSKITHTDEFKINGIVLDMTYPPGGSAGSDKVTFTDTEPNTWSTYHNFDDIVFTGQLFTSAEEWVYGRFFFGSSSYSIGGYDKESFLG